MLLITSETRSHALSTQLAALCTRVVAPHSAPAINVTPPCQPAAVEGFPSMEQSGFCKRASSCSKVTRVEIAGPRSQAGAHKERRSAAAGVYGTHTCLVGGFLQVQYGCNAPRIGSQVTMWQACLVLFPWVCLGAGACHMRLSRLLFTTGWSVGLCALPICQCCTQVAVATCVAWLQLRCRAASNHFAAKAAADRQQATVKAVGSQALVCCSERQFHSVHVYHADCACAHLHTAMTCP